jgi:glycerophosphodiester phosphodiesterase
MWPWPNTTLFSGHRGSGADTSYSGQTILENCSLSFAHAAKMGVDFIELDVQMSKDGIPVVYHDWTVRVDAVGGSAAATSVALRIPVGHMDAEQLRSLAQHPTRCVCGLSHGARRLYDECAWARGKGEASLANARDTCSHLGDRAALHKAAARRLSIFGIDTTPATLLRVGDTFDGHGLRDGGTGGGIPSLASILNASSLPRLCGVNIELKYPSAEEIELLGLRVPSHSDFVAAVLRVVAIVAPDRRIMYSSFDPDVAKIARETAPTTTPVLFLTEGDGGAAAADPRLRSFQAALEWASDAALDGVVTHVAPVLRAPAEAVAAARERGLALATYGRQNNEIANVILQKSNGVDMIILDDARVARALMC